MLIAKALVTLGTEVPCHVNVRLANLLLKCAQKTKKNLDKCAEIYNFAPVMQTL